MQDGEEDSEENQMRRAEYAAIEQDYAVLCGFLKERKIKMRHKVSSYLQFRVAVTESLNHWHDVTAPSLALMGMKRIGNDVCDASIAQRVAVR